MALIQEEFSFWGGNNFTKGGGEALPPLWELAEYRNPGVDLRRSVHQRWPLVGERVEQVMPT